MTEFVYYLAAEADPFLKVGGLGDVAGTLPGEINLAALDAGIDLRVEVILPFHPAVNHPANLTKLGTFFTRTPTGPEEVTVYQAESRQARYFLLQSETLSSTASAYSSDDIQDGRKYAFYSLAALELPKFLKQPARIIHANDWHTALALHQNRSLPGSRPKGVLSIHNLGYMGGGSSPALSEFGIKPVQTPKLPDWACHLPLPMGLAAADLIIPVSPGYAQEILTPEFGYGLEDFLASRQSDITGIVNGIDTSVWDPAADPFINTKYSISTLSRRAKNKSALQAALGLPVAAEVPLLAAISRLDQQKGMDILFEALPLLPPDLPWQCVLLGTGNPDLEAEALLLQIRFPGKFKPLLAFDGSLAHQIYSAADIFLMPSRYEPCGLSQLISQRYGVLPVARATGGLKDTILPGGAKTGTGYLFTNLDASTLASTILQAVTDYSQPTLWQGAQRKAMSQEVSWQASARKYLEAYLHLFGNIKSLEAA
jgi:starch synthase